MISVWIDTYPEDFREPPSYTCLSKLETFAQQHVPESDLAIRLRHKMDKFRKEDASKAGKAKIDVDILFHPEIK